MAKSEGLLNSSSAISKPKKKGKKKQPIVAPQVRSLKHARKVTGAFHRITHSLEQCTDQDEVSISRLPC